MTQTPYNEAMSSNVNPATLSATCTWIDPTPAEMRELVTTANRVTIGVRASGSRVLDVSYATGRTGKYGQFVRDFVFHCPSDLAPELADCAEAAGNADFAQDLRQAHAEVAR